MPIRPEHRWLYPIDWPELSKAIRFGRAKGRCEGCARPHATTVECTADGRWRDGDAWRDGRGRKVAAPNASTRTTLVYLATAHLDHDPGNNRPRNLKAFCQRCHILNDRQEHARRRSLTHRMGKALGDLFAGPYRRLRTGRPT